MRLAQFLDHLKDRTGESLRAVEWYRGDETELIFLREDLDQAAVQERAAEIHQNLTWDVEPSALSELDGLGDELATVSLREEAVLVHLPAGHNYGVVVSLDPDAARSLHSFVMECRETVLEVDPDE